MTDKGRSGRKNMECDEKAWAEAQIAMSPTQTDRFLALGETVVRIHSTFLLPLHHQTPTPIVKFNIVLGTILILVVEGP